MEKLTILWFWPDKLRIFKDNLKVFAGPAAAGAAAAERSGGGTRRSGSAARAWRREPRRILLAGLAMTALGVEAGFGYAHTAPQAGCGCC